jgi:streptomycin 6-kinase
VNAALSPYSANSATPPSGDAPHVNNLGEHSERLHGSDPAYNERVEFSIPKELAANCRKTPERTAWLNHLPHVLQTLEHLWALQPDTPLDGEEPTCSFVVAVRDASGRSVVLKISMPHMEAEHEADGLSFWGGNPTVRLLKTHVGFGALLLERCQPGTTLRALPESDQDVVISGLLRRLWRSPSSPHSFRPLSAMTDYWSNETLRQMEHWPDTGLVREGLQLLMELPRNATNDVLLATDLHAGNVLRAEREPWLIIDPKPFVGDPAYDATQHLLNCRGRLQADPDGTIRRIADLAGVEYERVRLWIFARAAAEPRDDWSHDQLISLARSIAP